MSWRLASRLSVITLALLVIVVIALWGLRNNGLSAANTNSGQSGLQGTDLGSQSAPDFTLNDQFGQPITLSQFHGKPVVLTFLYTHCPDVCPLTAEKLHTVQQQLGKDAAKVAMVAVSTDPVGDTQDAALNFSQQHKLTSNWHYLIGSQDQLATVWNAYSVYTQPSVNNQINHSSVVYLLDKEGRERIFFGDDFTTQQLLDDLKILLEE